MRPHILQFFRMCVIERRTFRNFSDGSSFHLPAALPEAITGRGVVHAELPPAAVRIPRAVGHVRE